MKYSTKTESFKAALEARSRSEKRQNGATFAAGYYLFDGLAASETYFVTDASKSYQFTPSSRIVILNKSVGDEEFVADPRIDTKPSRHLRPDR